MNLRQDLLDLIGMVCVSGAMVFVVLAFAAFVRGLVLNLFVSQADDGD